MHISNRYEIEVTLVIFPPINKSVIHSHLQAERCHKPTGSSSSSKVKKIYCPVSVTLATAMCLYHSNARLGYRLFDSFDSIPKYGLFCILKFVGEK
jgi:hypothetical protein